MPSMKNFWQRLNKPFFALAPMSDVTDAVFRSIIAKYGKPDVIWTEFVSADGLCSPGKKKLLVNFKYSEKERPIVAQLFGANPENIKKAVEIVKKLGFDGVDINMGCPDRAVVKQGAGGALIKNYELARKIIEAARLGAGSLPISVKTRVGFFKDSEFDSWISFLLEMDLAAITIHARTVKELSRVPARWDLIKKAVRIRNKMKSGTLIIGNGDVRDLSDARKKIKQSGCDGVMLGRAIFGNPYLFLNSQEFKNRYLKSEKQKLNILLEHTKLFDKYFKEKKNFDVMKKHFKAYVSGWEGAKELRIRLMECRNSREVENILKPLIT